MKFPSVELFCDVPVIGGGLASPVAALEAIKSLKDVVLVSKSRVGRSGCTIVSNCLFASAFANEDGADSVERHIQDTLAGGCQVNDGLLVHTLATGMESYIGYLQACGVEFTALGTKLDRQLHPGHSCPRLVYMNGGSHPYPVKGLSITIPLLEQVKSRGIRIVDNTPILHLLKCDGQVCGAWGLDAGEEQQVIFRAKATVIAAGGGGHLFEMTNNTGDVTGGSSALALEAGASLRDMEFVQFYPTMMTSPTKAIMTMGLCSYGAVLRDRWGERFMHRYDPQRGEQTTRDVMVRAVFMEMREGRSLEGGVYFDASSVPENVLSQKFGSLSRFLERYEVDLRKNYVVVSPTTHFLMGGIEISPRCETSVEGLFAAGEAAAGVHGANRIPGNALSEALVFGGIAGRAAASYARGCGAVQSPVAPCVELSVGKSSISATEIRNQLRRIMWNDASIIRSQNSLIKAQSQIKECQEALLRCATPSPSELILQRGTALMCTTAEAIVAAALLRDESRSSHYREDCPGESGRWTGSISITGTAGALALKFCPKPRSG